jgi:endonuclease/exonuclease/phosphatase family metal-dependent hydrolase
MRSVLWWVVVASAALSGCESRNPPAGDGPTGSDAVSDGSPDDAADAGAADSASPRDAGSEADAVAMDATPADSGAADSGAASDGGDSALGDGGASGDAGAGDGGAGGDGGPATVRLRLMAANLTAGNLQTYDTPPGDVAPGPGVRIMQGVRPDIVMLQEFRVGADDAAALQALADSILGPGAHVCRETVDSRGDVPNGIASRYPIRMCGEWQDSRVSNRDYAWARIDVPGPTDLWAISVHLHTNSASRPIEGMELRDNIRMNIPAGDYVVVGGDLNTDTITEPIFTTLREVLVVTPLPTDQFGNPGTNTNRLITLPDGGLDPTRNQPYDHVMPSPNLYAHIVPIVLTNGTTTYTMPHGLVVDTRVFNAATIGMIAPALLTDSAAVNMQHMGVVRDFVIPAR